MFGPESRVVVVVGAQWGDEGKGKLVDVLAERADWVVRYQGGANAGHTRIGNAMDTSPADFADQVQVNLLGAHHLATLVGAGMIERRRGDIVFVSTDAVPMPRPGIAATSVVNRPTR